MSTYSSGRASFAALSPLRPAAPDRRPPGSIDPEDDSVLEELRARDREVRAQETAHRTAAGRYAGATSYTYKQGPDGQRYAVEGETPIDTKPVPGNPQATVEKMNTVRAAALVPMTKSSSDLTLERQAMWQLALAQAELRAMEEERYRARTESSSDAERSVLRFEADQAGDVYERFERYDPAGRAENDYLI
ncbi:MAG: putative metalloprotease CJM1_0395 family protein [Parvularculaceae bacterium]